MKLSVLLVFIILSINICAQNTDSLKAHLNTVSNDSIRLDILNKIARKYVFTNQDSSRKYAQKGLELAVKQNKHQLQAKFLNYIGICYEIQGYYKKGLQHYFDALRINDSLNNKKEMAKNLNNIALVYDYLNDFEKSLEYHNNTLKIKKKLNNPVSLATTYINIAIININHKKAYKQGIELLEKALVIFKKAGIPNGIAACHNNLGMAYSYMKNYNKALSHYKKALRIKKAIKNTEGRVVALRNIAEIYKAKGNTQIAKSKLKKSIELAKSNNLKKDIVTAHYLLFEIYRAEKNFELALKNYGVADSLNDTLLFEENKKHIAEIEAKYQNEKKAQQIKILNKEKALQQTELKQQRIINYATATGLLMLLLLSFLIYKRYRDKTKANTLLTEKNHQINQQKEEITAQRDEIESQRDEITAQRDNLHQQKQQLEKANNELTQSISYARFIQSAALPTKKVLDSIIPNRFILFIPQNIVGGDFYWATQKEGKSILAAADCTGHGVPGGFMSMLGMSLLNEIINKEGHTSPEIILNKLRDYLINALHQKSQAGSLKDGMDISIISIDRNQNKLTCAGANNPIFMIVPINGNKNIPERAVSNEKDMLQEIQVDKMPISIGYKMKKFTQKEFDLNTIKTIYLLSDGFADQFGGDKNKKFMRKNLKELLLNISEEPFHEQYKILQETFTAWKGSTPQFDDVMIIGLEP